MNNNPLSKRYEEILSTLHEDSLIKLAELKAKKYRDYQLRRIHRSNIIPNRGDVFIFSPASGGFYWGCVIQANVNNKNGEDFYTVFLFSDRFDCIEAFQIPSTINIGNLLIDPIIVDSSYWHKGFFVNTGDKIVIPNDLDYGFYRIISGEFMNEYGYKLNRIPKYYGVFGIATNTGVAYEVEKALIIHEDREHGTYVSGDDSR